MEKSDVHSLNELASSLISEEHSGETMIKSMQSDVNSRFNLSVLLLAML